MCSSQSFWGLSVSSLVSVSIGVLASASLAFLLDLTLMTRCAAVADSEAALYWRNDGRSAKHGVHARLRAEDCSHLPIYDTRPIRLLKFIALLCLEVKTAAPFASGVVLHTLYRGFSQPTREQWEAHNDTQMTGQGVHVQT